MAGLSTMCDCGVEFRGKAGQELCPRCQRIEDEQYQNDTTPYVETDHSPWSRASMREYLGVTGDRDE